MKTMTIAALTLGALLQTTTLAAATGRLWLIANDAELHEATILNRTGDMILVEPGTYDFDSGGIDPGVTLLSTGGAEVTILRRAWEHSFNQDDVTIDGFTFEADTAAIALVWVFGDRVTIRNSRFKPQTGDYAVRLETASDFLIEGSLFDQSRGIVLHTGSATGETVIRNNVFKDLNRAVGGGSNSNLRVRIENNVFDSMAEGVDLGSIQLATIRNNIFANITSRGVAIANISLESPIYHNVFYRNEQAVNACNTPITVYNSIFQENEKGIDGCSSARVYVHHDLICLGTWLWAGPTYTTNSSTIWRDVHDPQFIDPVASDFHLGASSGARGRAEDGSDLGAYGGPLGNAWKAVPGTLQKPPTILAIRIEGDNHLNVGEAIRLKAEGDYEDDLYAVLTKKVTWTSSAETVLRSLGEGSFEGVSSGTVTVTASHSGRNNTFLITVLGEGDLGVTKWCDSAMALPGDEVTCTLSWRNSGNAVARGARLTETYPVGMTFLRARPAPTTGISIWLLGDIEPGRQGTVEVDLRIDNDAIGNLVNQVAVSFDEMDPDPADNTATFTIGEIGSDPIFADGFESGDIARWSVVVGAL